MERITSRENQRVKFARRVREGKEPGMIFLEGGRLCAEALRSGVEVTEAFASGSKAAEFAGEFASRGIASAELPDALIRSLADTNEPQGVIMLARRAATSPELIGAAMASRRCAVPLVVFLIEVNNPSNLGAVFRTAEAAGAAGVIISRGSADVFAPKALRAAMGASLRLPVWDGAETDEALDLAKRMSLTATAADVKAIKSYTETDWTVPRLLVLGSEAHGLSGDLLERMDEITFVPMENEVESLNLAVSAGILLFEARRQNG